MRSLGSNSKMIPKIIHVTWKTKDIVNSNSPIIKGGLRNLIDLNPDWNVNVYDDKDIDDYLKSVLDACDYNLLEDKHIVEKTDIWRLFKIYTEGGLYVDVDRMCNVALKDIVPEGIKWVLPTCRDYDFSHDFMMSAPGNPVFLRAINLYLHRRREGHMSVYFLGPQTYMHAITEELIGRIINTNPGVDVFTQIRETVAQMPFIYIYREDPPYDTITYHTEGKQLDHEAMKRQLYSEFGLKHWTGEW